MSSAAPHIYTLTGNLLAEQTLEFDAWAPGKTQRAARASFQVGGKGINVAKMLGRLGAPSTALCFTGGAAGAECQSWLRARGLAHRAFASRAPTRRGIVVRGGAIAETTFLGPDSPPVTPAVRACAKFLNTRPAGQVLALCGSFPGSTGLSFAPLLAALERWLARGTLVADTYGPMLAWAAARPLALVKINAAEFRSLERRRRPFSAGRLRLLARRSPVRQWVVTQGPGRIWLCAQQGVPASLVPPRVTEVSATGSGDVLFACLLDAWLRRGAALRDAVAFALPYAAANAAHPGVADFPLPAAGGH